jgi:PAS domain S-box-containing protein
VSGPDDTGERRLSATVAQLSEQFLRLAAGDFDARVERSNLGDPIDVLAYLFNNTAAEVGEVFRENERQRQLLEATLESMVDGVILLDANARIRRANTAIAQVLGRDPSTLVGLALEEILEPPERPFAAELKAMVLAGPVRDRDTHFTDATGAAITLVVNASAQRDQGGGLAGIVLVARDDRELRRARAQLQMADRLAAMGTIAAGVAHEINNPLAYVISNIDFITEELEEGVSEQTLPEILRALRASKDGAARVRSIVKDLRAFTRMDQETTRALEIPTLLDSALGMIRNEVRHHAKLVKEYGPTPLIDANEGRVVQVVINLVQNAAQSIPAGAADRNEIRVVTGTTAAGEALLEVRDTGSGIAPQHLGRIFDAFFTTKPIGLGTGLGLSICHKIVTQLRGRIEVSSTLGKGSSFRVILPPSASASRGDAARAPAKTPPARRRVLVVDDEPEVGISARRILGKEHDVDVVTRGEAALEMLSQKDYDLIICDLMMPEMTGMALYARVKETRPALAARMLFMSGGAFSPGGRDFLENVAPAHLDKPFDGQTLRTAVANMLKN